MYYKIGKQIGIFDDWKICKEQVIGFQGSKYKKFYEIDKAIEYMNDIGPIGSYPILLPNMNININNSGTDISIDIDSTKKLELEAFSPLKYDGIPIYIDGASRNNGKRKNHGEKNIAIAGYGVFFGISDKRNISEPLIGLQTNNRAELTAFQKAIDFILNDIITSKDDNNFQRYSIVTDSKYTINCFNDWMDKWRLNDYKLSSGKPINNYDIIKDVDLKLQKINDYYFKKGWNKVKFNHTYGHEGDFGNEEADRLANLGADKNPLNF